MSLHRIGLMAITILFTAGMTSIASAGCCGWGVQAQPVVYAAPAAYAGGCGGCGTAAYAAPITYAAPVVSYASSGWSGCGCGSHALAYVQPTVIAPSPIYVVNQGPSYEGAGIMVPYRTYSRAAYAAPASDYPYVSGYADEGEYAAPIMPRPRYHRPVWRGPRVVYRDRVIYRERHMPMPHMWPAHRRPLNSRG
jgi:hypothetical protein